MLKKIECYVQPQKLDELKRALLACGVDGMSVIEATGFGRTAGYPEGAEPGEARLLPKLKVELVVPEEQVQCVVDTVRMAALTGQAGSGKIFILPVEDAVRIRTAEGGRSAID